MSAPYALVIKKGTFQSFAAPKVEEQLPLSREEAIQQVIESLGERDVLISTTGMPSREVYEYRSAKAISGIS